MRTVSNPTQFASLVDRNGPTMPHMPSACWIFQPNLRRDGYRHVRVRIPGLTVTDWPAHRLAVVLNGRRIPPGKIVRHECDNPCCVRPDHLVIGTRRQNAADYAERGASVYIRVLREWRGDPTDPDAPHDPQLFARIGAPVAKPSPADALARIFPNPPRKGWASTQAGGFNFHRFGGALVFRTYEEGTSVADAVVTAAASAGWRHAPARRMPLRFVRDA